MVDPEFSKDIFGQISNCDLLEAKNSEVSRKETLRLLVEAVGIRSANQSFLNKHYNFGKILVIWAFCFILFYFILFLQT